MAAEIGSANDLEDLFGKVVAFLTTNASLLAAGQAWQVLRLRRDNLAALTSNMADATAVRERKMMHTCRYDARSLNINDPATPYLAEFYSGVTLGTSFVQMQLRQAREVKTVRIRAPRSSGNLQYGLRNFRLQYSDDASSWTTALTVSSSAASGIGEWRDYAVPGTPGSRLYWRIVIDANNGGTTGTICWSALLLLQADGTVANHFGSEVILKAPGMAGADEIFTGIRSEYSSAPGWYNLFLNGFSGFDPNQQSWFDQPGALPGANSPLPLMVPMVPCWNTTMPYWFAATGRSFRFAVKVSTSYEGGYLGFFLPYATPQQYPYPLAVGASLVPQDTVRSVEWRYSYADARHGVYPGPGGSSAPTGEGISSTLYIRTAEGDWRYLANRPNTGVATPDGIYGPSQGTSAPYAPSGAWRSVWPHCMNDQWSSGKKPYRECLGGGYMPQPCVLLQRGPSPLVFGELEGTYVVSGYQNAAENTTSLNGTPCVIFQNAYRNTIHEFWALSMDT